MKLVRADADGHVFQLGDREKQLLLETIKLYPLVPAAHYLLSRDGKGPDAEENQRLLEEALVEQRQENRRKIRAMLKEPARFRKVKSGFELTLAPTQVEWLLQVLNDVRVGSWLALGEPEQGKEPAITGKNAKYFLAMQLCGFFESALLAALGISESPRWIGE